MPELAGPALDREIARRLLGGNPSSVPPYSTENSAADLLLWRMAQVGVAFKVQELEGLHYCMLWRESPPGLSTGSSVSRPLAICRAALELAARSRRLPLPGPGQEKPGEARP
jgi:hypothetical protein